MAEKEQHKTVIITKKLTIIYVIKACVLASWVLFCVKLLRFFFFLL